MSRSAERSRYDETVWRELVEADLDHNDETHLELKNEVAELRKDVNGFREDINRKLNWLLVSVVGLLLTVLGGILGQIIQTHIATGGKP